MLGIADPTTAAACFSIIPEDAMAVWIQNASGHSTAAIPCFAEFTVGCLTRVPAEGVVYVYASSKQDYPPFHPQETNDLKPETDLLAFFLLYQLLIFCPLKQTDRHRRPYSTNRKTSRSQPGSQNEKEGPELDCGSATVIGTWRKKCVVQWKREEILGDDDCEPASIFKNVDGLIAASKVCSIDLVEDTGACYFEYVLDVK